MELTEARAAHDYEMIPKNNIDSTLIVWKVKSSYLLDVYHSISGPVAIDNIQLAWIVVEIAAAYYHVIHLPSPVIYFKLYFLLWYLDDPNDLSPAPVSDLNCRFCVPENYKLFKHRYLFCIRISCQIFFIYKLTVWIYNLLEPIVS